MKHRASVLICAQISMRPEIFQLIVANYCIYKIVFVGVTHQFKACLLVAFVLEYFNHQLSITFIFFLFI